jgi:hypothetical protein
MNCGVWVDLPDKHGLIYFGQLVTTPVGYRAPGDADGLVHMWYGDPDHASKTGSTVAGYSDHKCCHGQDDPWWQATGTAAHYRVPMAWIYNPDHLIDTAQGRAALWSRTPTSTFQVKTLAPELNSRYPAGVFGAGAVFDPTTRRIYVVLAKHDAVSAAPNPRPVVMVFQVA